MGLSDDLLIFLSSRQGAYRLRDKYLSGRSAYGSKKPHTTKKVSQNTFWATLSRLKKNDLVAVKGGYWIISKKGLDRLRKKLSGGSYEISQNSKRNMVVIFDVPERFHRKRDWLRRELTKLNFVLLQQSVWFGPSPLPEEFIESLRDLGMLSYLKFFAAKEIDIV